MERTDHWAPREVLEQLDGSLKALGTDHVDVYQFHSGPDQAFDQEDLWVALNEQVREGKVGHLGGKYRPGDRITSSDDWRSSHDPNRVEAMLRQVEEIGRTEVPPGVAMASWALAWCLRHPAVTSVIPGCKSVEQMKSNAAVADLEMVRPDHPRAAAP